MLLLLRHYPLSDDVGFRFSSTGWSEYPLTAEKYADWIAATPGELVGLFMDFETFGEHHAARTGILEFLSALPDAVRTPSRRSEWATVEEAIQGPPRDPLSVPYTMSWADQNRDLGAWLGNDLQRSAFEAAKKVGDRRAPGERPGDPDRLAASCSPRTTSTTCTSAGTAPTRASTSTSRATTARTTPTRTT